MDGTKLEERTEDIHMSPVQAGLANKAEDYNYSSARKFQGTKSLVNVRKLWDEQ